MLARIHQLSDIFRDARGPGSATPSQALLGDLNTVGHGVARLSRDVCRDAMRWRNLGRTEAEVWERSVLSCRGRLSGPAGPPGQGPPTLF